MVTITRADLAEVREPKAALAVEHQIIRATQRAPIANTDQRFNLTGSRINLLNASASIIRRLTAWA